MQHSIDYKLYLQNKEIDDYFENKRQKAADIKDYLEKKRILRTRRREIMTLTALTSLLCMTLLLHISLNYDIQAREARLESLNSEIASLRQENSDTQKRLAASLDLEFVRTQADKLGMVEPDSHNIAYYTVPEDEYMYSLYP